MPRSLETQRKTKGLKVVIGAIGAIGVLLPKKMKGGGDPSQQHTPFNKKGEELPIAPIAPIASTQTHITQGN